MYEIYCLVVNDIHVTKVWAEQTGGAKSGLKFITDTCLLYTSPSPRDVEESRMPASA